MNDNRKMTAQQKVNLAITITVILLISNHITPLFS